jgi:hypothetical protein
LPSETGDQAARRFLEFFAATIRNKNTRQAYYHATVRFFAWVDRHSIDTSTLVGLRDRARLRAEFGLIESVLGFPNRL